MEFSRSRNFLITLITTAVLMAGVSFGIQNKSSFIQPAAVASDTQQGNVLATAGEPQNAASQVLLSPDPKGTPAPPPSPPPPPPPPQKLSNPPKIIKAVYATGYSAGTKSYLNYLSNLVENTEINSVVVDVKGSDGIITYPRLISDIDALVRFLHDKNIYVIGRIAVFEDPAYSKARPELAVYNKAKTTDISKPVLWQDNNGLSWLDPASKDVWEYNISLARDAFYHGFDEINFDYVRFPSDGKMQNAGFPVWDQKTRRSDTIKEFFHYVRTSLPGEKISVDLFGLTTVNTDDMGIGQIIEDAFENFDYISPMVYPSHYADGFIGFSNPAEHPYEVIKYSMDNALNKEKNFLKQKQDLAIKNSEATGTPAALIQALSPAPTLVPMAKFRPWLQDFDMGADYTASMIKQQIKATQDALGYDFEGFMLWNPSNIYTQAAILKQ